MPSLKMIEMFLKLFNCSEFRVNPSGPVITESINLALSILFSCLR